MASPDKLYDKSRDELTPYEDSEFAYLISYVPNFYISQTDQTVWGSLLRDVAAELGRLEYSHAYDIVSKNAAYLTPPDAKRQWGDPLFINKNFPSPDQYDVDYRNLVVGLIQAFQLGATAASIEGVIKAYMKQDISVVELWKMMGNGYYDATDRNTIQLSVKVAGGDSSPLVFDSASPTVLAEASMGVNRLKAVTDDLYGAIDLAKPAHIGLNLTTIFGLDESIGLLVGSITEELRITVHMTEAPSLNPLYLAPFLDSTHPDTGLSGSDLVHNTEHLVFVPSPTGAAPHRETYSLATDGDFWKYFRSSTKGKVVSSGTPLPQPGYLSPLMNRAWEIKDDGLDIMDLD